MAFKDGYRLLSMNCVDGVHDECEENGYDECECGCHKRRTRRGGEGE